MGFKEGLEQTVEWYPENQGWVEDVITGEYLEYIRNGVIKNGQDRGQEWRGNQDHWELAR